MNNEQRAGMQIVPQEGNKDVSIVDGGIEIKASSKPVAADLGLNWGWVFIILDYSGSMKGPKLDQAKSGIIDFAGDAYKKGYRVGLIKFSDEAEVLSEPFSDIETLKNSLVSVKASRSTNLTAAIKLAHTNFKDLSGPRVMVIVTDGMPESVKTSLQAANEAKAVGIDIIAIGTDDAKIGFLNKLASRTELSSRVTNMMLTQAISSASLLLENPDQPQLKIPGSSEV